MTSLKNIQKSLYGIKLHVAAILNSSVAAKNTVRLRVQWYDSKKTIKILIHPWRNLFFLINLMG